MTDIVGASSGLGSGDAAPHEGHFPLRNIKMATRASRFTFALLGQFSYFSHRWLIISLAALPLYLGLPSGMLKADIIDATSAASHSL